MQYSTTGSSQNRVADNRADSFSSSSTVGGGGEVRRTTIPAVSKAYYHQGGNASMSQGGGERFTLESRRLTSEMEEEPVRNIGADGRVFAGGRRAGDVFLGIPPINTALEEEERSR